MTNPRYLDIKLEFMSSKTNHKSLVLVLKKKQVFNHDMRLMFKEVAKSLGLKTGQMIFQGPLV